MRTILLFLSAVFVTAISAHEPDTTLIVYYGYEVIDTVIINKSSVTFRQLQEAENAVQGITDNKEKHRAIVAYVVTHPDSDGSVYLMRYLSGVINFRKCLSELTEHAKNGMMKRLYDYIAGGVAEQDKYLSKTAEAITIGNEAKDFQALDINGNPLSLSSMRGKYVLLDFWGSWCGACIKSFAHLKEFYEQHRDHLEILGIACHDTSEKWKAAVKRHELPWLHVLNDEQNNDISGLYGIQAFPTYVLIAPDGKILQWMADDPDTFDLYFKDNIIIKK